ncbi:MAG TPA: hypothetical protein QKA08_00085 [Candidatus Megaira endosymbiont of Nemacystus decipiens]|nr:hypothetical protein [Candidatus Megaera endosymbiont of Nemacystus decipiens]
MQAIISILGLLARPGTDVDPTWWIEAKLPPKAALIFFASISNIFGQLGSMGQLQPC